MSQEISRAPDRDIQRTDSLPALVCRGKPLSLFQAQAGAPQQQQKKLSGLAQSSTLGSENQAPF